MGMLSVRKQKKQKERERGNRRKKIERAKRKLHLVRRINYALSYPAIGFNTAHGNVAFVDLIANAVAKLDFEDKAVFQEWETELYRVIRHDGWEAGREYLHVFAAAAEAKSGVPGTAAAVNVHFLLNLGQSIFNLAPESELTKYLPYNDVTFRPQGNLIVGIFDALYQAKGSGGTAYYSRRRPTVEVNGEKKVVAFSMHAIERLCDRLKSDRKTTYGANGDLFSFLSNCTHFERCDLPNGQLAFTFYDQCSNPIFWQHAYVTEVLGANNVDPAKGECYYRVGYCPSVVEGDFIKAKTLLFPGFATTPEHRAILRSSLSHAEKQAMIERTKRLDADYLLESGDLSLIKWFHDHGVPQVVQLCQPVFVYG